MPSTVRLQQKEERRIARGHPWIFSNELKDLPKNLEPGSIVDVLDSAGKFVGRGYANPRSLITVRVLTRKNDEGIDGDFFKRRIKAALDPEWKLAPGVHFARGQMGVG